MATKNHHEVEVDGAGVPARHTVLAAWRSGWYW